MKIIHILMLGILQGLTEFLPISSSGHLVLAESGFKNFKRPGVSLELFLHMGTLIAIIIYFRKDIKNILMDLKNSDNETDIHGRRWSMLIILGSIPTAIIGFCFEDLFERIFTNVRLVGMSLIITGLLLWLSDRVKGRNKKISGMTLWDAIGIGFVQGLAITPGISRSGSTIATGIFMGLDRDTSARFSFLLSIPAIFGAFLFEIKAIYDIMHINLFYYLSGAIVAGVIGYFCIMLLLKMVVSKRLSPFAYYCWILGILALLII